MSDIRPTAVKVGPFLYAVTYQEEVKHIQTGESVEAYCDHGNHVIVVGTEGCEDWVRSSLFHELKHAVVRLTVDSNDKKFSEERFIQITCNAEMALFRDNPELVKYLFEVSDIQNDVPQLLDQIKERLSKGEEAIAGELTRALFYYWAPSPKAAEIARWRSYIKKYPEARESQFMADRLAPEEK